MNILFLTHRMPYPPNKGDRIPTFHRLRYLSQRHKIHLVFPCFKREELRYLDEVRKYAASVDFAYINPFWVKVKSLGYIFSTVPLTLPYFYSKELNEKIKQRLKCEKIDLIYVYCSSMAQYVMGVHGIKKIIDLADSDAHKWLQYSRYTLPPISWVYYMEWLKLKKYEERLAKTFDHSIAISEDEKELFGSFIKNLDMSVVSNGVDFDYFKFSPNGYDSKKIIFVGAMDYFANIDGAVYFCKKILPLIRSKIPEIKFYIIGSNPTRVIKKFGKDNNIVVTGYVEDARPYLHNSSVCVVPLRIARGIQNKILEAMASGTPVVTTPKGNEGINAKIGDEIFVEDMPYSFAQSVVNLIHNKELRNRIARNARNFVENKFNWQVSLTKLESILNETYAK